MLYLFYRFLLFLGLAKPQNKGANMKPIFISEEEKASLIREFEASLNGGLYDGTLSFSKSYTYEAKSHPKATITYTAEAFAKTVALLSKFDSEVAWHALIRRSEFPDEYLIYDVIVYPQEVTGATVNTDDAGYAQFMIDLTDEQAEFMHAQCHSHVNMGTSPSVVDKTHQEKVLQCMNNEGFYVFQIWNKRLECTSFIYDFDHNIMYESKDIDLEIIDQEGNYLSDFIADAKHVVKTRTVVTPVKQPAAQKPTYSWTPGVNNAKNGQKKAEKKADANKPAYIDELDDDDDDLDTYYNAWGRYPYGSSYNNY